MPGSGPTLDADGTSPPARRMGVSWRRSPTAAEVPEGEAALNEFAARVYGLNAADAADTSSSTVSSESAHEKRDMLVWFAGGGAAAFRCRLGTEKENEGLPALPENGSRTRFALARAPMSAPTGTGGAPVAEAPAISTLHVCVSKQENRNDKDYLPVRARRVSLPFAPSHWLVSVAEKRVTD